MLLFCVTTMKEQIEQNRSWFMWIEEAARAIESRAEKWQKHILRKGLRHGYRKYRGFIDSIVGVSQMKYGLEDIKSGKVESPTNYYEIGRYMALANSLLKKGPQNGDIDAALTGIRIFEWLGQNHRLSVRNKMRQSYDKVEQISRNYGLPLSVYDDRSMAMMPIKIRTKLEDYLERNLIKMKGGSWNNGI